MSVTLRSFAKINLGLAIGLARPDGYHALATVYQTIAPHDLVTVTARRGAATRLTLTSNDERVPTDARNTAWKMVERALAMMDVTAEVEIHIEKRLPVQGGLGAGSANAAAALLGLERELGMELSDGRPAARSGGGRVGCPSVPAGWRGAGVGAGRGRFPVAGSAGDPLCGGGPGDRGVDACRLSGMGCAPFRIDPRGLSR